MKARVLQEKEIEEIYNKDIQRDFPQGEIKPLKTILQLRKQEYYRCYGIFEKEELYAYLFFAWEKKEVILLDYFAVIPKFRSQGIGGKALKLAAQELEKDGVTEILFEIERVVLAINEEQKKARERRKKFYLQNQCIESGLTSEIFGVGYEILYLLMGKKGVNCEGIDFMEEKNNINTQHKKEIERNYREIYQRMVKKKYLEKNVIINID